MILKTKLRSSAFPLHAVDFHGIIFKMDKKTLEKVLSGLADKNIRFRGLINLLKDMGFSERIKGDHHIFYREGIEEIINLQPLKYGKAKAYQVKQVRNLILKYRLHEGV
jgi:hypothetical protein